MAYNITVEETKIIHRITRTKREKSEGVLDVEAEHPGCESGI